MAAPSNLLRVLVAQITSVSAGDQWTINFSSAGLDDTDKAGLTITFPTVTAVPDACNAIVTALNALNKPWLSALVTSNANYFMLVCAQGAAYNMVLQQGGSIVTAGRLSLVANNNIGVQNILGTLLDQRLTAAEQQIDDLNNQVASGSQSSSNTGASSGVSIGIVPSAQSDSDKTIAALTGVGVGLALGALMRNNGD